MPSELKPCSKCGWEHHPTFKCWGDITDALGTRCTLCGTAAPSSLWRECDRPECPHRPEPATPATQKGAWSKNVSLASSAYPPATQADDAAWAAAVDRPEQSTSRLSKKLGEGLNAVADDVLVEDEKPCKKCGFVPEKAG